MLQHLGSQPYRGLSAKTFDCDHNISAVGGMDTYVMLVVDNVGCDAYVGAAVLGGYPEGDTQSLFYPLWISIK